MNNSRSNHKNNQPPAEKVLPRAPDIERLTLGFILQNYETHGHWIDELAFDDFPIERDKHILSAMVRLRAKGHGIDIHTLGIELDEAGHLANDTASYLVGLTDGLPDHPNIESYVKILKEKTAQRRLMALGQHLVNQGAVGFSSAEIVASTEQTLDGVKNSISKRPISVMTTSELLDLEIEPPQEAIEDLLEKNALNMIYGAQRSGKTLLMAQAGIAIATGQKSMLDWFKLFINGPVMFIQKDDQSGGASLQHILKLSPIARRDQPFFPVIKFPLTLGPEFYDWLEGQIVSRQLVLVVLDSYLALKPVRHGVVDIVNAERTELAMLSDMAMRTRCTLGLIHHESNASKRSSAHWSDKAGGTYAIGATPALHVNVSRFGDFEDNAPERLVRVRGRHTGGTTFAMRFRQETSDYEFIMEGSAAEYLPLIGRLKQEFPGGQTFSPHQICLATGVGRTTAHKQLGSLVNAGIVRKVKFGEYIVT